MFKHLLLPTDGSKLSEASVWAGVTLARDQGAKVTGFYVMPSFPSIMYDADGLSNLSGEKFDEISNHDADDALSFVSNAAQQAGVPYVTTRVTSDFPYQAIIKQAKESGCDLICMASHGRKGIAALLLGSETQKVLTHSSIPVLVHRSP